MLNFLKETFTVYSTARQVKIKSKVLQLTYLAFIFTVGIAYIWSLDLDLRNVYQKSCPAIGASVSKVKGSLSTDNLDDSMFQVENQSIYKRSWDTSDIIFPPYFGEDGGFVAVTNLLLTPNQTRKKCAELVKTAPCKEDSDCKKDATTASGTLTGICLKPPGSCEIAGWCPVEQNILPLKNNKALLEGVKDFTIMLKNSVEFPGCGKWYHRRNMLANVTREYLSECIYDIHNDTNCPKFRLGDIVSASGSNFSEVAITGGVFRIEARWTGCDFDFNPTVSDCFPKYYFSRVDDSQATVSPGWNFRLSSYHEGHRRTLMKMYGLKIIVEVTGEGKKFDFLQLILTLGATIGLFSVAPLVCDNLFELLSFLKKLTPCSKCLSQYSVKSRYEDDPEDAEMGKKNMELHMSNKTILESIDP